MQIFENPQALQVALAPGHGALILARLSPDAPWAPLQTIEPHVPESSRLFILPAILPEVRVDAPEGAVLGVWATSSPSTATPAG